MRIPALICTLFLVCGLVGCSSGPNMKEGKWEISSKIEMTGFPMKMPAITMQQCLTKDDLIPANDQKQQQGDCKVTDQKTNGDTVSWKMECKNGNNKSTQEGSITYNNNSFEGSVKGSMIGGPMPMNSTYIMKGKYIGPCD